MADIDFSEAFVEGMLKVRLESKRNEIFEKIELLAFVPEMGSRILPESVVRRFGREVRKVVIDPFDIIYRYFPEEDLVFVEGLLCQREAQ